MFTSLILIQDVMKYYLVPDLSVNPTCLPKETPSTGSLPSLASARPACTPSSKASESLRVIVKMIIVVRGSTFTGGNTNWFLLRAPVDWLAAARIACLGEGALISYCC